MNKPDIEKVILVVDDEPNALSALRRILRPLPYQIRTAESGVEALTMVAESVPDLIILDIQMPDMDGFQVLRRLKEQGLDDIPVIALTAVSSPESIMKGYREGAEYYITKPFRREYLHNIVNYLIGDLSKKERAKLEMML